MKIVNVYPEDIVVVVEFRLSEIKKIVTSLDNATFNDGKCQEENDFVIDIFLEKMQNAIKEL